MVSVLTVWALFLLVAVVRPFADKSEDMMNTLSMGAHCVNGGIALLLWDNTADSSTASPVLFVANFGILAFLLIALITAPGRKV